MLAQWEKKRVKEVGTDRQTDSFAMLYLYLIQTNKLVECFFFKRFNATTVTQNISWSKFKVYIMK